MFMIPEFSLESWNRLLFCAYGWLNSSYPNMPLWRFVNKSCVKGTASQNMSFPAQSGGKWDSWLSARYAVYSLKIPKCSFLDEQQNFTIFVTLSQFPLDKSVTKLKWLVIVGHRALLPTQTACTFKGEILGIRFNYDIPPHETTQFLPPDAFHIPHTIIIREKASLLCPWCEYYFSCSWVYRKYYCTIGTEREFKHFQIPAIPISDLFLFSLLPPFGNLTRLVSVLRPYRLQGGRKQSYIRVQIGRN